MRVEIRLQREVARLHLHDRAQSHREIAAAVGLSPNTAKKIRNIVDEALRPWDELSSMHDDDWVKTLGTEDKSIAQSKLTPDFGWVHEQLQQPDATLEQVWEEWRRENPEGVAYTQFSQKYRAYRKTLDVVMRHPHVPGQNLYVDFAGRTVEIKDPNGGPSIHAQLFVAAMGASSRVYCELVPSQETRHWVACHRNAFESYGGVPAWVVCDNLKAAVLYRKKGHIVINPAYRECLQHYGTAARPARPYSPRDKAKVENSVRHVQRVVLFQLRNQVFFSLEDANREIQRLTAEINARNFKKLPGSRDSRFTNLDQPALRPLPATPYEPCSWKYSVLVGPDYHVQYEGAHYSVPFHLARHAVDIRATETVIEAFHKNRRVARHKAVPRGETATLDEHRPPNHIHSLEGMPHELLSWATRVGAQTEAMVRHHLEARNDATNGLKVASNLRKLADEFGANRIEEVCAFALARNIVALKSIKSIIRRNADKHQAPAHIKKPSHANVRGADYFKPEEVA